MITVYRWFSWVLIATALITITGCGLFGTGAPDMTHVRALLYNVPAKQVIWSGGATTDPQPALSNVAHIAVCAKAPDGRSAVVSYSNGGLPWHVAILNGTPNPVLLGDNGVDLCFRGGVAFSVDSTQLAYIDAAQIGNPTSAGIGLPAGTLHLINTSDRSARLTANAIAAFDLEPAAIFALRASADGIVVQRWTLTTGMGTLADPTVIAKSLAPNPGCVWIDGQIRATGATSATFDRIIISLVDSCATTPTTNLIHTYVFGIALSGATSGIATVIYQHTLPGAINGGIDAHNVLAVTPDGKFAVAAVLNASAPGVADLVQINLNQPSQAPATVQSSALMADSPLDPTRRTWATIAGNAGGGQTLYAIDLTRPDQPAIAITDNNRSSLIGSPAWDSTGRRLLFTYIGNNSGLIYLDLNGALSTLVTGDFQGAAINAAGKVAVTIRKDSGDPIAVSIPDGAVRTLFSHPAGSQLIPLAVLSAP